MAASIQIIQGDITLCTTDAIVNAANSSLLGGGGVDGAIHRAAGPELLKFCRKLKGCPTGEAKITPAFNLPSRHIIHTVGPVWHGGTHHEAERLASCYKQSLTLAAQHHCKSIAFPNISTGVYGYPKEKAAQIALESVKAFISNSPLPEIIIFVCFDNENLTLYRRLLEK